MSYPRVKMVTRYNNKRYKLIYSLLKEINRINAQTKMDYKFKNKFTHHNNETK